MTSVPSHLPPLNGSKVLAFLIFLSSVVSSCTPAKAVKSPQVIKADTGTKPKDTGKAPHASDTKPAEKSQPAIPQGNEKNMPSSADMIVRVPVDTVSWMDVSQTKKPITIKQKPKVVFNDGLERKEIYHVTMLIPVDSDGGSKPSESLPADDTTGDDLFDDAAFSLRYRLGRTSRQVYCDITHFSSPFGYRLKQVEGGGEAPSVSVDLVESLVYLLGLTVRRLLRTPLGVVVTGNNRRGQSVAAFFRDCAAQGSGAWVAEMLAAHPADRVYANAVAELSFPGCDRLESIETVIAGQFGSP